MEQEQKSRIAVLTDSTADIPAELTAQFGIHVVPQTLILGDRTWRDGIDIDPATFYRLLGASTAFPSTSQPSIATFMALFTELSKTANGIVAVLVSQELSGTLNSASTAAANLPQIPIEIIDSRAASMQLGYTALAAARAASQGADLETVADAARQLVGRVHVYFVVDTLEYLHRGGRIGAATRLVGSALNLKPILEIRDGMVFPVTRVRTRRKALDQVRELIRGRLRGNDRVHMAVLHVAAPEEAVAFEAELREEFHPAELIQAECGPVVGAHTGPGTVGVVYYAE